MNQGRVRRGGRPDPGGPRRQRDARGGMTPDERDDLVQSVGAPYASPLHVGLKGRLLERERAHALCDVLDELGIAHRLRLYSIERAPGTWGDVALIDWQTDR